MLKIQRASAGSGKTYALAKEFITNLIAYRNPDGKWKLRNERQIEDAILHILAITFTNKATNEMKKRIINNLSLLAKTKNQTNSTVSLNSKVPYLKDLVGLTGASVNQVSEAATIALRIILSNYSSFRISTIDAFFQEILRTFTFEANIHDSYQLEIDSSYLTDAALDDAMHELDSHSSRMGNAIFWFKIIMREEARKSQKWNPFNKKASNRSVYSRLRNALYQLESEDYKEIKETLDNYFDSPEKISQLPTIYSGLKSLAQKERKNLLSQLNDSVSVINDLIYENNIGENQLNSNFRKHLQRIRELKINDEFGSQFNKILNDKSVFLKKYRTPDNRIDREAMKMYDLLLLWDNPSPDSYHISMKIYGGLLPYFGLLLEIRNFLSNVLDRENLIRLSDTSYILKKIIGENDAPFIYERIGTRINNYLIDEFQDTSKMQWNVIYPLLLESESKAENNLIIGDPKQSIYRFRNADHSLITHVVPEAFPDHIAAGFSKEDNTNWRSHTNIVRFNNYFFKALASYLSELSKKKGLPTDFDSLYDNVVQQPANQKGQGFVEIRIFDKSSIESGQFDDYFNQDEEISSDWFENIALKNVGPLISSLLERGYDASEIGVLVPTNEKGKKIIDSLISYNETLPTEVSPIDFISEESLLVSSSPAVEIIIGVLKKLTQPSKNSEKTQEEVKNRKYSNWNQIKLDYTLFSLKNPGLEPVEGILKFLSENITENGLSTLVKNLATPTLASLVEAIIKTFLDDRLRKSEALYISSFQDIINEYSAGHINDPALFLEWWNSRGSRMSVSSPEGLNAVQIMTIHKSKGLEFKCVILPFTTSSFTPDHLKDEWRWVKTKKLDGINLPPYLPVKTTPDLLGSYHENIYKEYFDQVLTDRLNMFYVAFTRARNELYIFSKRSEKQSNGISEFINQLLIEQNLILEDSLSENENLISPEEIRISENLSVITIGKPFEKSQILNEKAKEADKIDSEISFFSDYYINERRPRLRSIASKMLPSGEIQGN